MRFPMKNSIIGIVLLLCSVMVSAAPVVWFDGTKPVSYHLDKSAGKVVGTAVKLFSGDIEAVTGMTPVEASEKAAAIRVVQTDKASKSVLRTLAAEGFEIDSLRRGTDAFEIRVSPYGQIIVAGANGRGAAYGLLELSRIAGVSPWMWWGDIEPTKQDILTIPSDYNTLQSASVEKRGIFINDEDWSLRPWSYKTHAPSQPGQIAPATYRRVFELIMRLRGNAIWPAMHEGTEAFFADFANKELADSFGIAVGSSHCEPLLRNNVGEWDTAKRGRYNYITNREEVQAYWTERLQQVKDSEDNIFTIGMRGIHDGSMEGVKTMEEKFNALQQVIDDQQQLIAKNIGDPKKQIQVLVPYKEVLEIYEMGLNVPDYVTLMWCDDNYGYITRLSTHEEQKRIGGAGIYYHLSYWGRPHDHLWLTTIQPGLLYHEMRQAYDHNARKLWIANVHDPKVAGYQLELFLDMAWNINLVNGTTLPDHYMAWLKRQFGPNAGNAVHKSMTDFYRLTCERKPEFMGWSQVELDKKLYDRGLSPVRNSEFSLTHFGGELDRYLSEFAAITEKVRCVGDSLVDPELRDGYFAAIEYPVTAAYNHAVKILESQRARTLASGGTLSKRDNKENEIVIACAKSQKAYQNIRSLTNKYNNMRNGKWRHLMNASPRDLPVFGAPLLPLALTDSEIDNILASVATDTVHPILADDVIARNAAEYSSASEGAASISMLGHSMNAVALPAGGSLKYDFTSEIDGEASLVIALIPTQPNDNGDLRFSISIDGNEPAVFSLKEVFRSEGWKQNVLRAQALRSCPLKLTPGPHTLEIKAIDPNIIVDQWLIDLKPQRSQYYLLPVSGKVGQKSIKEHGQSFRTAG